MLRAWPLVLVGALLVPAGDVVAQPACDVSGTWSDNFGTIYLRMTPGGSLSGNYTWQNGTLTGIMDGVWINGTWKEEPTFAAPRDVGTFSWQVGEDCAVFTGSYAYAESPGSVAGSWTGTRVGAAPELDPLPRELEAAVCDPSGEFTTNLDSVIFYVAKQDRPLVVGGQFYTTGRASVGQITGNMSGKTLEGRWTIASTGVSGAFSIDFDVDCKAFSGRWIESGPDSGGPGEWIGHKKEATTEEAEAPTSPTNRIDAPPESTEGEHLPVDADEDDPLGVPAPPLALVLPALLALAVALRTRRR